MVVGALLLLVAAIVALAPAATRPRRGRRTQARLPHGADAALWSIVEAMPDPRNHLALTRDLSGEVHITDLDRATALAQAMDVVVAERASAPVIELTDPTPDRAAVRLPARTPTVTSEGFADADRDDDLALLSRMFFSGPPQLNRF